MKAEKCLFEKPVKMEILNPLGSVLDEVLGTNPAWHCLLNVNESDQTQLMLRRIYYGHDPNTSSLALKLDDSTTSFLMSPMLIFKQA